MKRKIFAVIVTVILIIGSQALYASAGEFDSVVPEEMEKDELVNAYNELRDAYKTLCGENTLPDEKKELFDPLVETDIVFEEMSPFLSSDHNYRIIKECVDDFRIEEVKTAIGNYLPDHQRDAAMLNGILDVLNRYGDFQNLIMEIDSFSGDKNVFYDGYTGIDESHFIYPYCDGMNYALRMGFVRDDWLFAEDMILKRMSDDMNDGIWFRGDSFDFERDTLGDGKIIEYKEEELYDRNVDYLLGDLSEEMVIRFEAENGDKMDYTLTDTDKAALQNVAKYVKIEDCLSDMKHNSELYYPEIPDASIIQENSLGIDSQNPFEFDVKLTGKGTEEEGYKDFTSFQFEITNNSQKIISEINGYSTLLDSNGKQILQIYFNFTGIEVNAGEKKTDLEMYYECSEYDDKEMEVYNIPFEEVTFIYTPTSVVFSDGTMEEF